MFGFVQRAEIRRAFTKISKLNNIKEQNELLINQKSSLVSYALAACDGNSQNKETFVTAGLACIEQSGEMGIVLFDKIVGALLKASEGNLNQTRRVIEAVVPFIPQATKYFFPIAENISASLIKAAGKFNDVELVESVRQSNEALQAEKKSFVDKVLCRFDERSFARFYGIEGSCALHKVVDRGLPLSAFTDCAGEIGGDTLVVISKPGGSENRISFAFHKGMETHFVSGCFHGTGSRLLEKSKMEHGENSENHEHYKNFVATAESCFAAEKHRPLAEVVYERLSIGGPK